MSVYNRGLRDISINSNSQLKKTKSELFEGNNYDRKAMIVIMNN